MFTVPMIKVCAQIVAGLGVSKVVLQVVKNNTTIVTLTDAILVRAGTLVLGSIAVEQATSHVSKMVDDMAENLERRKAEINGETEVVVDSEVVEDKVVEKEKKVVKSKTNGS